MDKNHPRAKMKPEVEPKKKVDVEALKQRAAQKSQQGSKTQTVNK